MTESEVPWLEDGAIHSPTQASSTSMSETPISSLRQRMIDGMRVRNFGEKTQKHYLRHVKLSQCSSAARQPLRRRGPATINGSAVALRFFFRVTLDRPDMGRYLTLVPLPERLRTVLSPQEVTRLLEAALGVKFSRTERGLRCRPSRVRGCEPEGLRHRRRPHAAARRAG